MPGHTETVLLLLTKIKKQDMTNKETQVNAYHQSHQIQE